MLMEGNNGEGVDGAGTDGCKLLIDFAGHALHLDADQTGFGWGLTAETPKCGGHFEDESILDGVGGLPIVDVGVQQELELERFFARENEFLGVGGVGNGVEGRSTFAFRGFGAGGFERVEAGCLFAFVVSSHGVSRIADGLESAVAKGFRILAKWVVMIGF